MDALDTWLYVLASGAAIALVWALLWSVPAIWNRRNDIADIAWGLVFPTLAALTGGIVLAPDWEAVPRSTLVLSLVTLWGLRLAIHIGRRAARHDEDKRYAAMRQSWGDSWKVRSVLQVFVLQAAIALVIAQPVLIAVAVGAADSDGTSLGWLDAVATVVFFAGFLLEAVADHQLDRFVRRKQAGEVEGYLSSGVWSWSRHPNYFGDTLLWWGFGLFGIAAAIDLDEPLLIIPSVVGPLAMNLLLRYGSGVAMSEKGRAGKPDWDAYVETTSTFIPRPPRRT